MFTLKFWADTAERCIKTGAQTLLAMVTGTNLFSLVHSTLMPDLGITASAMVLSLLTSIVSSSVGDKTDASLVR